VPYLAFDLDAFENCAVIGNGCGLQAAQVSHGLLTLWRHCWIKKSDSVTTAHLKGFFFGADVCEMLLTFGHIEATEAGWRVKGAAKYLNLEATRSANGKKAAANGNLKRGSKAPTGPQQTPSTGSNSAPALSSSIQHPTSTKAKALAGKKPPADPRLTPLTNTLVNIYAVRRNGDKYRHAGPADAQALKSLLPVATDAQISDRWRVGLDATGWASCSTFAQLASKWNDLGARAPPTKGSVIHAQQSWGPEDDALAGLSGERP